MASILATSDIPTLSLLYKCGRLQSASGSNTPPPSQILNDKVAHIRTDITRLQVDAIVNAANQALLGGGGVDGAIHRAAGGDLLAACKNLGGCEIGSAKITDGYNLPAKKVIHAVGPQYWLAGKEAATLLRGCYRRSLELAIEHNCESVAFSAVSTGVYGYPQQKAAEVAIGEVRRFLLSPDGSKIQMVVFCSFREKDEEAYQEWLPKLFPPTENNSPAQPSDEPSEKLLDDPSDKPISDRSSGPAAGEPRPAHNDTDGESGTKSIG